MGKYFGAKAVVLGLAITSFAQVKAVETELLYRSKCVQSINISIPFSQMFEVVINRDSDKAKLRVLSYKARNCVGEAQEYIARGPMIRVLENDNKKLKVEPNRLIFDATDENNVVSRVDVTKSDLLAAAAGNPTLIAQANSLFDLSKFRVRKRTGLSLELYSMIGLFGRGLAQLAHLDTDDVVYSGVSKNGLWVTLNRVMP